MKIRILFTAVLLAITTLSVYPSGNLAELTKAAISADPEISGPAIKALRELGQQGSDALFETYAKEIYEAGDYRTPANWVRIANALDKVTMQKDSYASLRIFWHTDIEEAKKVSRKTNRPILSLRLLGNLNEELSCANSRLFRALLYPENHSVLHEKYVLHWKTVRPAPKVTIDFGDGRKIIRTLTGNSIHYVLDSDGNVIDALPGLYSSVEFRRFLNQAKQVFDESRKVSTLETKQYYKRYQELSFQELVANRKRNMRLANIDFAEEVKLKAESPKLKNAIPTAIDAAPSAVTKMAVTAENLVVDQITDDFSKFASRLNLRDWKTLAELRVGKVTLRAESKGFIWRQLKDTGATMAGHSQRINRLQEYIALDTVRNEYLYRPAIYEILANNGKLTADEVNEIIYDKVFLTPNSDPWLGLNAPDIYTAIYANGIVK